MPRPTRAASSLPRLAVAVSVVVVVVVAVVALVVAVSFDGVCAEFVLAFEFRVAPRADELLLAFLLAVCHTYCSRRSGIAGHLARASVLEDSRGSPEA